MILKAREANIADCDVSIEGYKYLGIN